MVAAEDRRIYEWQRTIAGRHWADGAARDWAWRELRREFFEELQARTGMPFAVAMNAMTHYGEWDRELAHEHLPMAAAHDEPTAHVLGITVVIRRAP